MHEPFDVRARVEKLLAPLMHLFHQMLSRAGEEDIAETLPWRMGAGGSPGTSRPRDGRALQATSIALQLLNLVEELALERARGEARRFGAADEVSGSFEQILRRAQAAGHSEETIAREIGQLRIEPVLTAHPTECKRRTVLRHHRTLYQLLAEWDEAEGDAIRHGRLQQRISGELERLWRTGEVLIEKPTVADEVRNVLHYFTAIFPSAVEAVQDRLQEAWQRVGFDPEAWAEGGLSPRIRFGNWVGGDRDGHPLVSAEITVQTLTGLRRAALDLVDSRLSALATKLSLAYSWSETSPGLQALRDRYWTTFDPQSIEGWSRYHQEPLRQLVLVMRARLPAAEGPPLPACYADAQELISDLVLLRAELVALGAERIAVADVDPVIRHVDVFGFHLAALDLRQNSEFHERALEQLLEHAGESRGSVFADWSEEDRLLFLRKELQRSRPFAREAEDLGGEAAAAVFSLRALAKHHLCYGPKGLGSLIVSMTRSTSDLLVVFALAREAGLLVRGDDGLYSPLQVVPLFETIPDLEAAPRIMEEYLREDIVRRSLWRKALADGDPLPVQEIMVGYSDSGKDGGVTRSFHALSLAQKALSAVGERHGVRIRFFHGRGGTIGRGAGPTHRFLASLPAGSLKGDLRLTEQGETIEQKYGHVRAASHNLELLLAGTLGRTLRDDCGTEDPPILLEALQFVAERAERAYRALIERPQFLDFFSLVTPIDAIEHSRIGSRPARRTGRKSLQDLRAIPWVFAWSQSRFNLPGWFGLGAGLNALAAEAPALHQALVNAKPEASRWPPIHYLISNAATALALSSKEIMQAYAALCPDEACRREFLGLIEREHAMLAEQLDLFYRAPLAVARSRIHRAIELRSEALRPIHERQISLLRDWRAAAEPERSMVLSELLLSVNAIAAGIGSTG